MWLFTSFGFFSVVRKSGEQHLTVRARCSPDRDRLRQQFMPGLSATSTKGGHDYPFRATISQPDFAKGMALLGTSLDYNNFKDEVAEKMGQERADTYQHVWSTLRAIANEKPAKPPTAEKNLRGRLDHGNLRWTSGIHKLLCSSRAHRQQNEELVRK